MGGFEPGNFAALTHGSRSPRYQALKQQTVGKQVRRELGGKADRAWLIRLIVDVEARLASYREYLANVGGALGRNGQPRGCLERQAADERKLMALHALWEGRTPEPYDELRERLNAAMVGRWQP